MSDESIRRRLKEAGFQAFSDSKGYGSSRVKGYCPMGCGQTLTLTYGGEIACARADCPRPEAGMELLDDPETGHIVNLDEDGFTIRHPLRERLDDELLSCDLHAWLIANQPPVQLGRYRVVGHGFGREDAWTRLDAGEEIREDNEAM